MLNRIKKLNYLKLIKIAAGAVIAMGIALLPGLKYFASAGIILILTIQDTKRETVKIALKRIAAFCAVTVLSAIVFGALGYGLGSFGIVLALFVFVCFFFDMNEAIAMNSVLATHYLAEQSCGADMIANEFLLLFIGAGTGILLNLFIPKNIADIKRVQQETDERFRRIIKRMSVYILADDKSEYTGSCFEEIEEMLGELKREAIRYIGNSFSGDNDYFLRYVNMRREQCKILKRIYSDIVRINFVPEQARPISDFFDKMSDEFHERNDAADLLSETDRLFEMYSRDELPSSRAEFENRALLFHILTDIREFLMLKSDFSCTLSSR